MSVSTADLFGDPPLIKGEDGERYGRLLAAVREHIKPKTLLDEFLVRDMTNKLWEKERWNLSGALMTSSAFVDALAYLLGSSMEPSVISLGDPALQIAREYYSGEAKPDRVDAINLILARLGISEGHIRAKATQICANDLAMFNRMIVNLEASLRVLQKESDRRLSYKKSTSVNYEEEQE